MMVNTEGTGVSPDPCHLVRTAWEAARPPHGGLPARRDIGALSIAGGLHGTFLLTRDRNLGWRFRFAGRDLAEMTGLDLQGMAAGTIFAPSARGRIAGCLEAVREEPARAEISVLADALAGPVRGSMVLLPLAEGGEPGGLVIGALTLGRIPREAPCRLEVGTARVIPVAGGTVVRLSVERVGRTVTRVTEGGASLHAFMR